MKRLVQGGEQRRKAWQIEQNRATELLAEQGSVQEVKHSDIPIHRQIQDVEGSQAQG